MHSCRLTMNGRCDLNIVVDIHGTRMKVRVLIDTGFVRQTGYGLKLPASLAQYAYPTGTASIALADGEPVLAQAIPNARIVEIEGRPCDFTMPTLFMDGPRVIGMKFLERCILNIDGPASSAKLEF